MLRARVFVCCALLGLVACEGSESEPTSVSASSKKAEPTAVSIATAGRTEGAPKGSQRGAKPERIKPLKESSLIPPRKFYGPPRLVEQFREAQGVYDLHEVLEPTAAPLEVVCRGREPCRQLSRESAGKRHGNALQVLSVSLAAEDFERELGTGSCEEIEHWAVSTNEKGLVTEYQLLLKLCNDGYGAAGIGTDEIKVSTNHFHHSQFGGSNHRWNHGVDYQLYPRRIDAWSEGAMIATHGSYFDLSWDFRSFSGEGEAVELSCDPDSEEAGAWTAMDVSRWTLVPVVETPLEYAHGGWKEARLGQCAAALVQGGAGFVIHGKRETVLDQQVRIVGLRDGSFVVEIKDDHFVLKADKVLYEDHLELWTSEGEGVTGAAFCQAPRNEKPKQWGVRLADGKVFAGFGNPPLDAWQTEVEHGDGFVLVHLVPKEETKLISFVYSDSDDGKKQKSLVATSALKPGKPTSLGARFFIHAKAATCKVRGGKLEPFLK